MKINKDFTGVAATENKDNSGGYRRYVGDHLNGLEHGIGVYESRFHYGCGKNNHLPSHRFAGQFIEGKCTGLGMKTFFHGFGEKDQSELFCGEYKNDQRNGIGYWKLRTGAIFVGEFKDHTTNGFGTMFSCNGFKFIGTVKSWIACEGSWYNSNNEEIDITSLGYYKNGFKYEGERLPNIEGVKGQHGYGRIDYNTGEFYVGNWNNGVKEGYGEMKCFDWSIYEGEWKNDMGNGNGVMTFPNGSVWAGTFKDGKGHGKGVLKTPDGTEYERLF